MKGYYGGRTALALGLSVFLGCQGPQYTIGGLIPPKLPLEGRICETNFSEILKIVEGSMPTQVWRIDPFLVPQTGKYTKQENFLLYGDEGDPLRVLIIKSGDELIAFVNACNVWRYVNDADKPKSEFDIKVQNDIGQRHFERARTEGRRISLDSIR